MRYMLDTNTLIYLINRRSVNAFSRFQQHPLSALSASSISVAELEFGAAKSGSSRNKRAMDTFLQLLHRPAFDEKAATSYGVIRASLEARGTPIGPLDTLIAAHALSLNSIIVTNNVREFSRVPGLQVEDWTQP